MKEPTAPDASRLPVLNLNIHLHMLFVDGAYTFNDEQARFHHVAAPTQTELQRLLHAIATRIARALEKLGTVAAR